MQLMKGREVEMRREGKGRHIYLCITYQWRAVHRFLSPAARRDDVACSSSAAHISTALRSPTTVRSAVASRRTREGQLSAREEGSFARR